MTDIEREDLHKVLYRYCADTIPHFATREALALDTIDEMRCPLWMADERLYGAMEDAISDYLFDHDMEEEIDPEEVFWA